MSFINWGPEMTPEPAGPAYVEPIEDQVTRILNEAGWRLLYAPDWLDYFAEKRCPACGERLKFGLSRFFDLRTGPDYLGLVVAVLNFGDEHRRSVALCPSPPIPENIAQGMGQE